MQQVREGKKYWVMHIDTVKGGEYAVERLSPAAVEWGDGEYDRRCVEGSKLAKELHVDLAEGDFALFQTEHGVFPAKVMDEQADGSFVVQWYNCNTKTFFFGATKKRPFGTKKRPFLVNSKTREREAHRTAVCVEETAVWGKESGASNFHHQAH